MGPNFIKYLHKIFLGTTTFQFLGLCILKLWLFKRQYCFRNDIVSWLNDNNIDIHYKYNSQSHWWLQLRFSIKTTNSSHQPIVYQHFVQESQFLLSQHQASSGAATSLKIRRKSSIILLLRILRVSCYLSCCNYAITLLTLGRCKMS